jgi:GT2 family glycosyltransferase
MKYSILLVVHGHLPLTRACLESIYRYSKASEFELLVLDNASPDGTLAYLKAEAARRGNVRVFANGKNDGFMSPMNFLAREAQGDYIVVMNNDLTVCAGWLRAMREPFDHDPALGQVGLAQNCGEIGPLGEGLPVRKKREYIEASCMMIPRWIVRQFGLFDDNYYRFGYYEDSDLSLRLRERGFGIATVGLPIVHRRASTMGKLTLDIEGYRLRNAELFRQRWADYLKRRTFEKSVLFRRSGAVGDVIMATPVLRAYKENFPHARIDFATWSPLVLEGNPYVERVVDLRSQTAEPSGYREFFDLDLAYERRPTVPAHRAYAEAVGVELNGHRAALYAAKQNGRADDLIVFHVDRIEGWPGRNAPVAAFRQAAVRLARDGYRIVEVGKGPNLAGVAEYRKTTFPELCALISSAAAFVGQDSAPFHVAQAYGVPAAAAFGAILPELRDHSGKVFPIQVDSLNCLGCHHYQRAPRTAQTCLRKRPLCMDLISAEMVERQARAALKSREA